MSRYLIDRIERRPASTCVTAQVVAARGDGHLEAFTIVDGDTGALEDVPAELALRLIGASPRTDWLGQR